MKSLKETDFQWHAQQPDVPDKSAQQMKEFFDAPIRTLLEKVNEMIGEGEALTLAELGSSDKKQSERLEKLEKMDYVNNVVLYTQQSLTDEQKAQARANIGVVDCAFKKLTQTEVDLATLEQGNYIIDVKGDKSVCCYLEGYFTTEHTYKRKEVMCGYGDIISIYVNENNNTVRYGEIRAGTHFVYFSVNGDMELYSVNFFEEKVAPTINIFGSLDDANLYLNNLGAGSYITVYNVNINFGMDYVYCPTGTLLFVGDGESDFDNQKVVRLLLPDGSSKVFVQPRGEDLVLQTESLMPSNGDEVAY